MSKADRCIRLVDTSLRDGSHAVSHQFTERDIAAVAEGLDKAGVPFIEVSHGDGLGGSSINYGRSRLTDEEMLRAASAAISRGSLTVLLLPGIGTQKDLEMALDCGAGTVRVATHVTEADIAEQHIGLAKKMGMTAFGFLMMVHMRPPEVIVEQAKLFESFGADVVYLADSAGAMLPGDVRARVDAVVNALSIPVGFHAHANLGLAIANSLAAVESGASFLDGTCRGIGAGAGNAQLEVLIGVLEKAGYRTDVDFYGSDGCCGRHSGTFDAQAPGDQECLSDPWLFGRLLEFPPAYLSGRGKVRPQSQRYPRGAGPQGNGGRPGRYDHQCCLRTGATKGGSEK